MQSSFIYYKQWRIQDFLDMGAYSKGGGTLPIFFPKTAWNWKTLDWEGRACLEPPLDLLMLIVEN